MIRTVSGVLRKKSVSSAVVEVGGVGLRLFMPERAVMALPEEGETVSFFTHLHVKEDALELYGFQTEDALHFFELLISVSSVGPRSALSVLEVDELERLKSAVKENRPDLLTKASGIGRKTAERIILELRSKVQATHSEATVRTMEGDVDLLDALVGLGYRREEARAAISKIGEDVKGLGARLKEVLGLLRKK